MKQIERNEAINQCMDTLTDMLIGLKSETRYCPRHGKVLNVRSKPSVAIIYVYFECPECDYQETEFV